MIRDLRIDFLAMFGLALHVLVHDRHVVAATVRGHARRHFIHDDADAVDVRRLVDLLTQDLLRRHVLRRTDYVPGLGQLRVPA